MRRNATNDHGLLRFLLATTALLLLLAASAHARDGRYDEVHPVEKGTRLVIEHDVGALVILTWERDAIGVEARYDADDHELDVRDSGLWFNVDLMGRRGPKGYAELALRVPEWIPVEVRGHEVDVEIEGVLASVDVDLVGGDVFVRGGRGRVDVTTVHGGIEIQDATGEIDLTTVHEDVELHDCSGEVRVECVNGDVRMEGLQSAAVDVATTHGDILIDGTLEANGDFHLSTHAGDVAVSLLPGTDLTVTVDTFHGTVRARLDAELEVVREGKRYRMVLGEGRGRLSIESFEGDVVLYDPKRGRGKRG